MKCMKVAGGNIPLGQKLCERREFRQALFGIKPRIENRINSVVAIHNQ